jgi:hypothetical protein
VPTGKLYLRISNYGPDSLQSVPVTVYCGGVATDLSSGTRTRIPVASQGTFNITIAPGQTNEFPTQIDLDLDQFAYDFSCEVRAATDVVTDPVPSNNTYSEHIELLQQVHIIQADLAVTDIFLQPEPADPSSKDIYCRITNKGPDALQNITVLLTTGVQYSGLAPTFFPGIPVTITLQPSDTGIFDTGIDFVETGMQLPFQVTCQISSPSLLLIDPDSSNNSYVEPYNRYAELSELQADLAVTDIFPDSLPNGNIFCRITNRGPDALQNAVVFLVTFRTDNPGPQETKAGYIDKWLTVTLQHNQTGEFDTGWDVTASLYPIEFSCAIVPYLTDPVTGNDSYSEIINTSP